MPKSFIAHTIVLFLLGCSAQGDVSQVGTQESPEEQWEPGQPYEEIKNYGAYDCSGAWQTLSFVSSQGEYAIVAPIPCVDDVMIDMGDPPPERVDVTSQPSRQ